MELCKYAKWGKLFDMVEITDLDALSAVLEPVKKMDVTHLVVERLRMLLERGILKPGSKLPPEPDMCKLLGVSRPSLRQAYKALDILGVIRAVPGDGTYINESTSKMLSVPLTFLMLMKKISLDDVFEFRILLEVDLARRAASRVSEAEMAAMKALLETMAASLSEEQKEAYLEAEYEFHNCIARAARNPLLLEVISMVSGLLWETRKELVNFVPSRSEDFKEHHRIYEAITARNPEAAGDAMRQHLLTALNLTRSEAFLKRNEA
ncbi:MAG TPA: FadR/GntR family transcriptional regulator [Terriglobia bacterium]|nr:FadR/GntR family transcriptional regulator [Terriglobia bacterium]